MFSLVKETNLGKCDKMTNKNIDTVFEMGEKMTHLKNILLGIVILICCLQKA